MILVLLFVGIRGSFGHRAINISDAMYSNNRVLNEIAKNSIYSMLYSIYANRKLKAKMYKKLYGYIGFKGSILN